MHIFSNQHRSVSLASAVVSRTSQSVHQRVGKHVLRQVPGVFRLFPVLDRVAALLITYLYYER